MQRLRTGDCIIELGDKIITDAENARMIELRDHLITSASHIMLYSDQKIELPSSSPKMKNVGNEVVIHNFAGKKLQGTGIHTLMKECSPTEVSLGACCILRPKQEKMGKLAVGIAEKWLSPSFSEEQIAARPKDNQGRGKLLSPLGMERQMDRQHSARYEVYRAFRAYLRNLTDYTEDKTNLKMKGTPISKKKGVDCTALVAYTYKLAAIQMAFPEGAPQKILQCVAGIEQLKKRRGKTKLTQLDEYRNWLLAEEQKRELNQEEKSEKELLLQFGNFVEFVRENLADKEKKVELSADDKTKLIGLLKMPIKGQPLRLFTSQALAQPDRWEFIGFLCFVTEKQGGGAQMVPYVMDTDTYREFLKELPEDPEQWPTLLLNESQAERVQTLARGFAAKNKA